MRYIGQKNTTILLTLAVGAWLAAGSLLAAESTPASASHRTSSHVAASRGASTHSPAHSVAHASLKKSGTAAHATTQHRTVASSGTAHHTAGKTTTHAYTTPVKGTPTRNASQRKGTSGRYRSTRPSKTRTSSGQQRLAHLHMAPERVQEIQHALISQGYMQGDATGEWDSSTRDAMLHYQASHGFPPTGLPEAKSLMKLGLGPHPLSPELDHGQVASAGVTATVQNVFTRTPNAPPDAPSSPAALGAIVPETK